MPDLLPYRSTGDGPPLLLVHGAAENVQMLEPQAIAFADIGRRVAWYDRRGTGGAPRDNWPCGGVAQHADDAAAIVRALGGTAQVLGFSSGGVVAIALADRHPDLDVDIIAWEPAAIAALEGGLEIHDEIMKPIEAHLDEHPDDWTGAYAVMLEIISGGHADLASAAVAAQMVNAEAAVRDDARIITRHEFAAGSIPSGRVRLARGGGASGLHAGVIERLAATNDLTTMVIDAALDHEVYLLDPEILAAVDWSR